MSCFFQGDNSQRTSNAEVGYLAQDALVSYASSKSVKMKQSQATIRVQVDVCSGALRRQKINQGSRLKPSDHLLSDEKTEFIFIDPQSTPIHLTSKALRAPVTRKLSKSV